MKTNSILNSSTRVLLLFAAATLIALAAGSSANAQYVNGDIPWESNVEKAKKMAQQQNKLVLLHFDASWCRPCKALETYVFRSHAVKKAIAENVIPVKLDADRALDMVNEYDVSMVPFDVIITPAGRVITERRSPAEAENYAKMVSGTSNASRMLEKEKLGPIAHQRQVIANNLIGSQDPTAFRVNGPKVEEFGLSKDSSLLQRRQNAFTDLANGTGNGNGTPKKQTNPFVNSGNNNSVANNAAPTNAAFSSPPSQNENQRFAVENLERDQFLSRERNWVAPSTQTRRAEPKRIVNDRYFESIGAKKSQNPYVNNSPNKPAPTTEPQQLSLPESSDAFELALDSSASETELSLPMPEEVVDHGEFKAQTTSHQAALDAVIDLTANSLVDLNPDPPQIDRDKLCLKGKCPVTLITEGRWEDGDTRFGIVHRNRTYIFASAEKLNQFRSNPDNFSPVLAGYDPVIYQEQGKLVEGLAENGVFMGRMPNQKVILFSDAQTRSKFQASPKKFLESVRQATNNTGSDTLLR